VYSWQAGVAVRPVTRVTRVVLLLLLLSGGIFRLQLNFKIQ